MFLGQDERLLLFHHRQGPLLLDTLKGFRDAGIETIKHAARQTSWHEIEPQPGGPYNWSEVDKCIELSQKAGLKVLLDVYWRAPDWVSSKQEFVRNEGTGFIDPDGVFDVSWLAINPFNTDAMDEEEEFLHKICSRYSSDDVMCCYAMPHSGERILPFGLPFDYTEGECVDIVLRRQDVFAEHYDELWVAFHPWGANPETESVDRCSPVHNGNEHIDAVVDAILEKFPQHTLNHFISVYFVGAGLFPLRAMDKYKVWTGAQFTTGVVPNSRRVDDYGVHGLVMACSGVSPHYQFGDPGQLQFDRAREAVEILARGKDE